MSSRIELGPKSSLLCKSTCKGSTLLSELITQLGTAGTSPVLSTPQSSS